MKQFFAAALAVFLYFVSFSQEVKTYNPEKEPDVSPKEANDYFAAANFYDALDAYLVLLEKEQKNEKYNYRIGVCYLNTNINKTKAIPYLEKVTRMNVYDPNAMYLLGRAYHYAHRFDDAIKCYNQFAAAGKGSPENLKEVSQDIQYCYNAKELLKFPVNVTFDNLGKSVNSQYADYFPFVPTDESIILFNSRRPDVSSEKNPDGSYSSGIYISRVVEGTFSKSKNIGPPVNMSEGAQEIVGLAADGNTMLIYNVKQDGNGDIFIAYADKSHNFAKAQSLDQNINSAKGSEIAASISSDGNTIYFASDRSGGMGGTDIWTSNKLPNGKWSTAVNLKSINTPLDEDFPNISPDGKTLYFSSKGHTSMGGYDIFKAEWDDAAKSFQAVKNIGYPINTCEDDMNFRVSASGRYGYIAAVRASGYGDLDIYRVTFNDVEPEYSIIKGSIVCSDSTKKVKYADVFITVTDEKSGEIYGNYAPNPNSGRYVIIVPPGNYQVATEASGYKMNNEPLNIMDKSSFRTYIDKDIVLSPEK